MFYRTNIRKVSLRVANIHLRAHTGAPLLIKGMEATPAAKGAMKEAYIDYVQSTIKTYHYNGCPITFNRGDAVMVSATEMAKPFGKEAKDWLKNQSTKEFINELANVRNLLFADLVQVKQGSPENGGGTWFHEDVALEFARWLSPKFAIWCNDRIKELVRYGMTATAPTLEAMLDNPDLVIGLATKLKAAREENARQTAMLAAQNAKIAADAPKVLFAEAVVGSQSSCLIGELAKVLTQNGYRIGQNKLFRWLRSNGYLGTKGERYNIPNQQYVEMGLFELKKNTHSENGVMKTTITPKVTGKGQQYFVNRFLRV